MRSALVVLAAITASVVSGGPAVAENFRKPPSAEKAAQLRLNATATEARGETRIYVVQLAAKPAIAYEGGVAGFAKTAPAHGARYNSRTSQVQMYTEHLATQQNAVLSRVGASGGKIYSFRHAMNGFAARMTPAQAARLRKDKTVLQVWEDQKFQLDTNNSPRFLRILDEEEGLRAKHGLRGEDIIIGVIDSGIVQEHPSLDDTDYGPPPAGWSGTCEAGEGFAASDCNNKLIGARYYVAGFGEANTVPEEFISPRDSDGHGTHTATTAGGNENVQASLAGVPVAEISGIAPRARVAAYKACWQEPGAPSAGCTFSDSMAATDQAVADGVDILSFSVGTAFAFNDPQDIAFLFAADAGVFVSRSAGNEGPGPQTTAAGEPWVTTVAASTQRGKSFAQATRINSPKKVAGDYASLESSISKSLQETGPVTNDLVAADPIDACAPIGPIGGKIALITRGVCTFDVKLANAVDAGASAVLMYSDARPKTVMGGVANEKTLSIPAVMIDNAPGLAILAQLTGGVAVNATLSASVFVTEHLAGNVMADFSSRGPYPTVPDWIKPDITAPGVQILAGGTPEPNDGSFGGLFQYLSGTSMSTPHIAGLAALIIEAFPDWTPAMVKSALMTTSRQNIVKEDGATKADPFDFGAGHVDANKAIDPGLVYDAGFLDYLAASCGTDSPLVVSSDCDLLASLGFSLDPSDLNLPSIGIGELPGTQTVHRTVTNVSGKARRFTSDVKPPPGFRVEVSPENFHLEAGESMTYAVMITNRNAPPGEWRFGRITWETHAGHVVRSPIAVKASALIAPERIDGAGTEGSTSFDVTFGYTGAYMAGAHGLADPFWSAISVTDDPFNSFDFDFGTDEQLIYLLEAPPGAAYLQFNTYDAYNDKPGHDLDLYVFYCPDFFCTQVGQSFNATSNEQVGVQFPLNDPAIDDPYAVFVHGFNTEGGAPASGVFFDWTVEGPTGNLAVSGPSSASIGATGTINAEWAGLLSGPGEKQVGAVSHSDATAIQGLTILNIANDAGGGYCDFFGCP
jgi:hypothetical protein